jgi:hypothetical protein
MSAHRSFSLVLCLLNDGEPRRVQSKDGCRTCAESAGRAFARVGGGSVQLYSVDATAVIITRHRRCMRSARRMVAGYASRQVCRMCTSGSSSKRREAAAACKLCADLLCASAQRDDALASHHAISATSQRGRRRYFATSPGHQTRVVAGSGALRKRCAGRRRCRLRLHTRLAATARHAACNDAAPPRWHRACQCSCVPLAQSCASGGGHARRGPSVLHHRSLTMRLQRSLAPAGHTSTLACTHAAAGQS